MKNLVEITPEIQKEWGIKHIAPLVLDLSNSTCRNEQLTDCEKEFEWGVSEGKKYKQAIMNHIAGRVIHDYKETDLISQTLKAKFINTSEISELLQHALKEEMNMIIYGRGGFGKSEMCSELFDITELKNKVFIKSLSEATTEEDLFGGINIKKMTDTGIIEYNCEQSFASKEIVIFEEIFDANPRVLCALKDALTAKEIRNGNQRYPMKTKIIIGLTNKSMDDIISDNSVEALTQRFPISYKLDYPVTSCDVIALIKKRWENYPLKKIAAIIDCIDLKEATPRKILEIAKYIKNINLKKSEKLNITNINIGGIADYLNFSKKEISPVLKALSDLEHSFAEEKKDVYNLKDLEDKLRLLNFTQAQLANVVKSVLTKIEEENVSRNPFD